MAVHPNILPTAPLSSFPSALANILIRLHILVVPSLLPCTVPQVHFKGHWNALFLPHGLCTCDPPLPKTHFPPPQDWGLGHSDLAHPFAGAGPIDPTILYHMLSTTQTQQAGPAPTWEFSLQMTAQPMAHTVSHALPQALGHGALEEPLHHPHLLLSPSFPSSKMKRGLRWPN